MTQDRMYNGYFTVEAAFIIPMVLFIYLFIIYMAFFQYDRCLMTQDTYRLALQGSRITHGSKQSVYNHVWREKEKQYMEKYMALQFYESDICVSNEKIVVKQEGKLQVPFLNTKEILPKKWEISIEKSSKRISPISIIREYRRIERIANSLMENKQ